MTDPENEGTDFIDLANASIRMGDTLVVIAHSDKTFLALEIWRVDELEDMWTMTAPLEELEDGRYNCVAVGEQLEVGIYLVVAAQVPSSNDLPAFYRPASTTIFEIVTGETDEDLERIGDRYRSVIDHRTNESRAGIGTGPVAATVLVFIEDILMTSTINFRHYTIEPIEPVGWNSEAQAVQDELQRRHLPRLTIPQEVQSRIEKARPSIVMRFPMVRADSVDDCARFAESHAEHAVNILALERGSLGKIYCVIAWNSDSVRFRMSTPQYLGNLVGGFASGEDPQTLRAAVDAVSRNPSLEFYSVLYGEAVRENRADFKFTRLWSFLESVARSRNYVGQPLRGWTGAVIKNASGNDRTIQDDAFQIVYELLRDLLSAHYAENSFASGLRYGNIAEQLAILYQRRNCTIHGGPCLCKGASKSDFSQGRVARVKMCANARNEESHGIDQYLLTVRDMSGLVLRRILDGD